MKLLIALCSYASAYATTSQPELAEAATLVVAEPISPATLKRFPHLAPYVGHVLLGTPEAQVVLAGISAVPGASVWQPAALAFFTAIEPRREPLWHRQQVVTGIDIKNDSSKNEPSPHQIAVDLGVDQESGAPFARFIYGTSSLANSKITVTWRLDNKIALLSLALEARGKNSATLAKWLLRINGRAENILGPVITTKQEVSKNAGSQYLLRYQNTEVMGILGYQRFTIDNNTLSWVPPSRESNRPAQFYGIELALSQAAAGTILARVESLKNCFESNQLKLKNSHDTVGSLWRSTCESQPNSGLLKVRLNPKDPAVKTPQPIFVFDRVGNLIQLAVITDDRYQTIDLPAATEYQLADTAAGRTFNGVSPFNITTGQTSEVTLPPRDFGTLQITVTTDGPRANLLFIGPMIAGYPDAAPLLADGSSQELPRRLGHRTWLTHDDRLSTMLLAGSYLVSLANGRSGIYCSERVIISSGHLSSVNCGETESNLDHQRIQGFIYGNLSPSHYDLRAENKETTDVDHVSEISAALGLDFLSSAPQSKAKVRHQGQLVPVMEILSESSDTVIRYWPTTTDLAERWSQALLTRGSDVFSHFKRFLKDEGATGWLELGCPGPTASTRELEQLILTIQPDAVELFGCSSHRPDELIGLWARLAHNFQVPILLTPAPIDLTNDQESFLPRMVIDPLSAPESLKPDAWALLQRRNFSLSAGAVIFIRTLRPLEAVVPSRDIKTATSTNYDLVVDLNVLAGFNPKEILVFTESGSVKKAYPPRDFKRKGLIRLHDLDLGKAHWLRIEIRGTPNPLVPIASAGDDASTSYPILATTNFLKISDLVSLDIKAKESH